MAATKLTDDFGATIPVITVSCSPSSSKEHISQIHSFLRKLYYKQALNDLLYSNPTSVVIAYCDESYRLQYIVRLASYLTGKKDSERTQSSKGCRRISVVPVDETIEVVKAPDILRKALTDMAKREIVHGRDGNVHQGLFSYLETSFSSKPDAVRHACVDFKYTRAIYVLDESDGLVIWQRL